MNRFLSRALPLALAALAGAPCASKYGSYLSALTLFGTITGLDPQSLGMYDLAARDLGISQHDAYVLQQIAAEQVGFVVMPEPASLALVATGLLAFAIRRRRA